MSMDLSNLLAPTMMFFALGLIVRLIRSDLEFPPHPAKALTIYLWSAAGFMGGKGLAQVALEPGACPFMGALGLGNTAAHPLFGSTDLGIAHE